jgi:integrase
LTQLHRLNSAFIKTAPIGKYNDGSGLWLHRRKDGGAQWVLRLTVGGKRREMGLGGYPNVSLKDARMLAGEYRKSAKLGNDPIRLREAARPGTTLRAVSEAAFEARKAELKGGGKAGRWFSPLQLHVLPRLGKMQIEDVSQIEISETLQPIWHSKGETARKATNRLSMVFKYATAMGLNVDLNAVAKAKALLGKSRHVSKNIPALAWRLVPDFYASLSEPTTVHLALKLLILTGVRSYAIRNANLDQFDGDTWIIPAENMKGQITQTSDFQVPLSSEAQIIISTAMHFARDGFLFPGIRTGVISDASLARLMQRRGMEERPHGFRSSLRTWLAETTTASEQAAEIILAHKVGTKTIRAYRRTDHFEERSVLMERWARHVTGEENVIELTR